ncbi:sugar nucleotide-binding protein [Aeromonas veronii]
MVLISPHITPAIILNAVAYTNVAGVKQESELAMAVNGEGVARLARLAKHHDALLVHFSTDYVFDGLGHRPWREKINLHQLIPIVRVNWLGSRR